MFLLCVKDKIFQGQGRWISFSNFSFIRVFLVAINASVVFKTEVSICSCLKSTVFVALESLCDKF